jgi:Fe2+ or Zn2+ uptake regulation protein
MADILTIADSDGESGRKRMRAEQMLICNGCGKKLELEQEIAREGILQVEKTWGYFSGKDGETHSFCLCEECYDRIRKEFVVPVAVKE